jgi:hypothetical protein
MARSLAAITAANQKPRTTGAPARVTASSKLGTSSSGGIRGGGVKGSNNVVRVENSR